MQNIKIYYYTQMRLKKRAYLQIHLKQVVIYYKPLKKQRPWH